MRSISAIFLLTLRSLLRSRFLLCVTLLALAVVVLLPLTLQDDGTINGRVQVLVRYTLGVVSFLLSVGTLGTAPGLVAGELESRRLQQVLVKPVRFGQIWLGKWLALVVVNAVVLGGSVLLAHGLMRWTLRDSRLNSEQTTELRNRLSTARAVLQPVESPIPPEAVAAKVIFLIHTGALAQGVPDSVARQTAIQRIRFERNVVRPGGERRWLFPATAFPQPQLPAILRVQFLSSANEEIRELDGEWTVGEPGREPLFRTRARLKSFLPQEILVPPFASPPTGPIEVTFRNVESASPASVLFHTERGTQLLVPAGSYGMNLFRAYWLILFKLALLAAIGVTMGSLFYTPVAVLTGFFALVLISFSGYIGWVVQSGVFYVSHEHHQGEPDHADHEKEAPGLVVRVLDPALKVAYRGMNRVLAPLRELEPMERVADGERVPWPDVGRGFFAMVGVGGGVMAMLAIGVFRRRETG